MMYQSTLACFNVCRDCGALEHPQQRHLIATSGKAGRLCWNCIKWPMCKKCGKGVGPIGAVATDEGFMNSVVTREKIAWEEGFDEGYSCGSNAPH